MTQDASIHAELDTAYLMRLELMTKVAGPQRDQDLMVLDEHIGILEGIIAEDEA